MPSFVIYFFYLILFLISVVALINISFVFLFYMLVELPPEVRLMLFEYLRLDGFLEGFLDLGGVPLGSLLLATDYFSLVDDLFLLLIFFLSSSLIIGSMNFS